MSYFDFYVQNLHRSSCELIAGTCMTMCPEGEAVMREEKQMIHVLEVTDTEKKLIKCFNRSAADSDLTVPNLLRPYTVLQDTVKYLMFEVTKRSDVPLVLVYDFLCDRLRSVRQDIIIQRLESDKCISLLEPMVRFHVYFGYKLCQLPLNVYDPVLNKKWLLECLKWCLSCYDSIEEESNEDGICECLSDLDITSSETRLPTDQILMECLYIISNLEDMLPLHRYLSLTKNLKRSPSLQLAYKIAIANYKGNFIQVTRLSKDLCPLMYCAFSLHLPVIQRQALLVLSRAYNSRQLLVPLSAVRCWLLFDSDDEVSQACSHYGLQIEGPFVKFSKEDFQIHVEPLPKKLTSDTLNLSIEHVLSYRL